MQTQTKIFIIIIIIILAVIGIVMGDNDSTSQSATQVATDTHSTSGTMNEQVDNRTEPGDAKMAEENTDLHSDSMDDSSMASEITEEVADVQPLTAGTYTAYAPDSVASSEAESIILNFSATWCPSCRTFDRNINKELSEIPEGVEIYKVDYDSNIELRKKYGVTTQHTFVLISADGTMIKKWTGGNGLSDVISKL